MFRRKKKEAPPPPRASFEEATLRLDAFEQRMREYMKREEEIQKQVVELSSKEEGLRQEIVKYREFSFCPPKPELAD